LSRQHHEFLIKCVGFDDSRAVINNYIEKKYPKKTSDGEHRAVGRQQVEARKVGEVRLINDVCDPL